MAQILSDGEKIYVPNKNENITLEMSKTSENKEEKVNINTATAEELSKLSGIGESTADKIIEYRRQNGKFTKIEELKNVTGVGDGKFEKIKDKIKVK